MISILPFLLVAAVTIGLCYGHWGPFKAIAVFTAITMGPIVLMLSFLTYWGAFGKWWLL